MLRDRFFFPLMIVIIAAIIYVALYPGQKNQLNTQDIRDEGYIVKGEDLKFIEASPGTSVAFVESTKGKPAYLTLKAHLPRETAPPSAGVFVPLNAPYETAFAEKNLRMTVRARQSEEMPIDQFRMGYFTAGAGDSGWKIFTLTSAFKEYSFTFRPNAPVSKPDLDYFGIWPDEQGESRQMDVSEFRIDVLD